MIDPERTLYQAVILQALKDALNPCPVTGMDKLDKRDADRWIRNKRKWFCQVCEMAGFDPDFIRDAYVNKSIRLEHVYGQNSLARMTHNRGQHGQGKEASKEANLHRRNG